MADTATKTTNSGNIEGATPMMRQYLSIRESYPDYLLFYRMGDFYELFFEDAVKAAEALDIALTRRGKHLEQDIPMCGVPAHSYESYLLKLIKKGFKVAICEQMEPPEEAKKRGAKSVVKREVTRIITPGTITEDALLDAKLSNYLVSVAEAGGKVGLAWVDISTGQFQVTATSRNALSMELSRLQPKEILLPDRMLDDRALYNSLSEWRKVLTPHVASFFEAGRAERRMKEYFKVASLEAFGSFTQAEVGACGSLLEYIELTQIHNLPRLDTPKKVESQDFMLIDAATRRNLELTSTLSGEYKGSLLSVINYSTSAMGARLLVSYLSSPLLNPEAINQRLDMVEYFWAQNSIRAELRDHLRQLPDMERALSRICVGRGGPRDLLSLRQGISEGMNILSLLEHADKTHMPAGVLKNIKQLGNPDTLLSLLESALADEVPLLARDGGTIREGFDAALDEMRQLCTDSQEMKLALRDRYRIETGIEKLKLAQNNVIGMYLEVTASQAAKMPEHFIHRQTMAGAMRYTTPELKELETKIINAAGNALSRELELFEMLCSKMREEAESIALLAQALATLDVSAALAQLATEKEYVRPKVDSSAEFYIQKGRHPVVEESLKTAEENFIGNNCNLSKGNHLWLITGPNMAGKSTFLRQNALVAILAQMGSFVPAEKAHIGVVDRLFSRVGAADDLARGRSTFMVEMVETATILNQSTERSLVILDEIGRGTATFDGLSIAWAVIEYLHEKTKCRTLFATHYHELTTLASRLSSLACHTMKVKEWQGDVIFLHEVISGTADRSYGIHVAQLAGLPADVIGRAKEVMQTLEEGESGGAISRLSQDLPLFSGTSTLKAQPSEELIALKEKLAEVNPDNLSPRDALDVLYSLKNLLK